MLRSAVGTLFCATFAVELVGFVGFVGFVGIVGFVGFVAIVGRERIASPEIPDTSPIHPRCDLDTTSTQHRFFRDDGSQANDSHS